MISFFRKDRLSLMEKNKTGAYIKYALGEIILVMIGILLAFQVNAWGEVRNDRNAEHTLYQSLIMSLENDLEDANDKIAIVANSIKAQEHFVVNSFDEFKNKFHENELDHLLNSVRECSRSFFPNYTLYDKISNNNQIELISSAELQMKIIELYEQHYKRYNDIDLNLEHQMVFSLNANYFSRVEDRCIVNNGPYLMDFETLKKDYGVLNSECRKIHYMTEVSHSSMIECKNEIESLLSLLLEEVE
jgi:hypothetical protein